MNDEQQELEYMMKHIDRLLHGKTDQFKREMYRYMTTSLWTLDNLEAGSVDGIDIEASGPAEIHTKLPLIPQA